MDKGLIFIGAGIKGTRKIDDKYQPFLDMDGRTCIEIIVDEVIKTNNNNPLYIWGPEEDLKNILSSIIKKEKNKREIKVISEKSSPIESLFFTYLEYLKREDEEFRKISSTWECLADVDWKVLPAYATKNGFYKMIFYLPSDIPLVRHEEVDFLIMNEEQDCDLLMGWSLKDGFEEVIDSLQNDNKHFDYSKSKINFSKFLANSEPIEARFNNFFCGRPLAIDPDLYIFFEALYKNRNLIKKNYARGKEKRRIDPLNFLILIRAFARYIITRRKEIKARIFLPSYFILNTYFHSLGLAGKNYQFIKTLVHFLRLMDKRLPSYYLDIKLIEKNIKRLTGNKIGVHLSNVIGPLFDIDTKYEYEFVKANYRRLRDDIGRYYKTRGIKKLPRMSLY